MVPASQGQAITPIPLLSPVRLSLSTVFLFPVASFFLPILSSLQNRV